MVERSTEREDGGSTSLASVATGRPVASSHSRTVMSLDALYTRPSLTARAVTALECPVSWREGLMVIWWWRWWWLWYTPTPALQPSWPHTLLVACPPGHLSSTCLPTSSLQDLPYRSLSATSRRPGKTFYDTVSIGHIQECVPCCDDLGRTRQHEARQEHWSGGSCSCQSAIIEKNCSAA